MIFKSLKGVKQSAANAASRNGWIFYIYIKSRLRCGTTYLYRFSIYHSLIFSKRLASILASVSFWPLLIIESWLVCPNTCFSHTTCSLIRYNVEGELDCFNCKTGVFSDYSLQCLQTKAITIHVFAKKFKCRQRMCEDAYRASSNGSERSI